ncbi:putative MAPEG superfamily protein related to glutathione S-transferase [Synechococcus sp. PCC 7502]|uniref:MAPEG family protein n=1 Tax=Synechococcus sp. PCC 7502 TaxID=1173263 RepID=UPI00029F855D|nr:MAPEG family protein [Synechococcus sp. PCC 7502]AFY72980.1 putative MAPEG superfamily protein related to glutathione S-transferase [Synechococcus sp. PCC 7502]
MIDIKQLQITGLVTILSLIVFFILSFNVGIARAKYKVPVPQITGDENFERVFRVQQNTLEQLIIFIPALWMFALFVNAIAANILGGIWIIGRILYAWGYYAEAGKRGLGFAINSLVAIILLLGSVIGIGKSLLNL